MRKVLLALLCALIVRTAWAVDACTPVALKDSATWCADSAHYGSTYCDASYQTAFHNYYTAVIAPDPNKFATGECTCIQNSATDSGCNWQMNNGGGTVRTCDDWFGDNTVGETGSGSQFCPMGYTAITSGPNAGKCYSNNAKHADVIASQNGDTITRNADGNISSYVDALGNSWNNTQFDSSKRLMQYRDPTGNTNTLRYFPGTDQVYSHTLLGETSYVTTDSLQAGSLITLDGMASASEPSGAIVPIATAGTIGLIRLTPIPQVQIIATAIALLPLGAKVFNQAAPILMNGLDKLCEVPPVSQGGPIPEPERPDRCQKQWDGDRFTCYMRIAGNAAGRYRIKNPASDGVIIQDPTFTGPVYSQSTMNMRTALWERCMASASRRYQQCLSLGAPQEPLDAE